MVGRDGAEARKERLQRIARSIQAALNKERKVPLTKIVAVLQYEMGLTKDKIMEYLQVLADLEQFTLNFESNEIRKTYEENAKECNSGGIE